MMQPRSSSTRGKNESSSGYCELMASATVASTQKVPYAFTLNTVSKSWQTSANTARRFQEPMMVASSTGHLNSP
jgi:hypothetical protein